MTRVEVLSAVNAERDRQEAKWGGRHAHGSGSCMSPDLHYGVKLAVLSEEVGEVARAILETEGPERLRTELVQVAAVAVAWAEAL